MLNDPTVRLAAGGFHTCQVNQDGTVRCWGANFKFQSGSVFDQPTPANISGLTSVVAIAAGDAHTCALPVDGTVRCWGDNGNGQLGDGTTTQQLTPVSVSGLTNAVAIAAGFAHTCALLADGSVRCWGWNASGQLGDGTRTTRFTPVAVMTSPTSPLNNAVALAAGGDHTCALLTNGSIRCWGDNFQGQLGDGTTTTQPTPVAVVTSTNNLLTNTVALAAGTYHTCALLADGRARCWGYGADGQLGDGFRNQRLTPVAVRETTNAELNNATGITAGAFHTCALMADGRARCWGLNHLGELGDDSTFTQRDNPSSVRNLTNAVAVEAGGDHTCALLADGSASCWGSNFYGQLGNGASGSGVNSRVPVAVLGGGGSVLARDITAGSLHTCAVRANGTVACWGYNVAGQVGDGGTTNQLAPFTLPSIVISNVVSIAAGGTHTCALLADGNARCWGNNRTGQVGDGTTAIERHLPVPVSGLSNAVALAAGYYHTCALLADGSVRCWGYNGSGQIGDGTPAQRNAPVPVLGLTNAVAIAAGMEHTCALLADGSTRCWGDNDFGQLGDGTFTPRSSPVPISVPLSTAALTAGDLHTCALHADGSGRCWGYNGYFQLGDNLASRSLPGATFPLASTVAIAAGQSHTCALVASGGARCWGSNSSGQLGDGTTTSRSSPTVVTIATQLVRGGPLVIKALGSTTQIATGNQHTCAVQANGGVLCWGNNSYGQLGDSTTDNKLRPVVGSSFTLNIDPRVILEKHERETTVTILGLCDEGQRLQVDVTLTQDGVSGAGAGGGECTGGLARYTVKVKSHGDVDDHEFQEGPAEVSAVGVIHERGFVVDTLEWTRAVVIVDTP